MLSIVIPTLNAEEELARAVASVRTAGHALGHPLEIIVSDGGSSDGTVERAAALGVKLVSAPRGRGPQLRAGAEAAQGDWFLFLHADTCLSGGWETEVRSFIAGPATHDQAAVFDFALDDGRRRAQALERLVRWRNRIFCLPYGDQGLLMSRDLYDQLGGFQPLPLFEDVDIVRRLCRHRLHHFQSKAVTSAVRYRKDGYIARTLRNAALLCLYFAGVPPRTIGRLYS